MPDPTSCSTSSAIVNVLITICGNKRAMVKSVRLVSLSLGGGGGGGGGGGRGGRGGGGGERDQEGKWGRGMRDRLTA